VINFFTKKLIKNFFVKIIALLEKRRLKTSILQSFLCFLSFDEIEKSDFHGLFCFIHHNNPEREPVFSPMVPLGGPSALIR